MLAAVQKTVESNAVFGDFSHRRKTENLKSAAVGENGSVPIHELVQSARPFNKVGTRAKIKMIRIRKNYLTAHFFQFFGRKSFYGRHRTDGHEYGRFDHAVRGCESADTRARLFAGMQYFILEIFHYYFTSTFILV